MANENEITGYDAADAIERGIRAITFGGLVTYVNVTAQALSLIEARVAKLNERGAANGVAGTLTVEAVEFYSRPVATVGFIAPEYAAEYRRTQAPVEMVRARLVGRAPVINGWSFVASVEVCSGGNIVRQIGDAPVDASRYSQGCRCDHCGTSRRRIDMWVIRNNETGDERLIGRNCLADYLREGESVATALRAMKLWKDARDLFVLMNTTRPGYFGGSRTIATLDMLTWAAMLFRQNGGHFQGLGQAALDTAGTSLVTRGPEPMTQDYEFACAALAWVRSVDAPANEFMRNLTAACSDEFIRRRNVNIAAAALVAFKNHVEREIRRALAAQRPANTVSDHFGNVGSRYVREMTVVRTRTWDGNYGTTTLISLVDPAGNEFKWFASGAIEIAEGAVRTAVFTVKKHDEYRGTKQTVITRAALHEGKAPANLWVNEATGEIFKSRRALVAATAA